MRIGGNVLLHTYIGSRAILIGRWTRSSISPSMLDGNELMTEREQRIREPRYAISSISIEKQ